MNKASTWLRKKHSLPIPEECLVTDIAILGKKGAGKSYTTRLIQEWLCSKGRRLCVIDPTGVHWGIRLAADGKSPGYPVVIFGGDHGDIPIDDTHGEQLGRLVATTDLRCVIDLLQMTRAAQARFFADFANSLMRHNRQALQLFIDECHLFMPQHQGGGGVRDGRARMIHEANNLVAGGRVRGIRICMISQRAAKVHKDSLTQVETMISMRLVAPQDRGAAEAWIGEWTAGGTTAKEVVASLASLPTGTGWVWAPEQDHLKRTAFPRIATFDSMRAPEVNEEIPTTDLSGAKMPDLEAMAELLKPASHKAAAKRTATVHAQADVAAALRSQIQGLETELKETNNQLAQKISANRRLARALEQLITSAQNALAADTVNGELEAPPAPPPSSPVPRTETGTRLRSGELVPGMQRIERDLDAAGAELGRGEAKILQACIQYPDGLERSQLTVLTGYKRSSRDTYINKLVQKGLVETASGLVLATATGRAAMPSTEALPTGAALQRYWLDRLGRGERSILQTALDVYPSAARKDDVSEITGYRRSSRDTYINKLRARQLITEPAAGEIRAADTLFN